MTAGRGLVGATGVPPRPRGTVCWAKVTEVAVMTSAAVRRSVMRTLLLERGE